MPSQPIPVTAPAKATLSDRVYVYTIHVAKVLTASVYGLLTQPFTSGKRPPSLYRNVIYTIVRANINSLNSRQQQWILPSTEQCYLALAMSKGFQPETEVLHGSNARLHWLGSKNADKILLYFHGGGFSLPCSDAHFLWAFEVQQELNKGRESTFSIAFLNYTLAPEGQYPKQLQQAAEALEYLIEKGGKKPEDVYIGGDSAGGNITLAVLSQLLHPHVKVPYLKNGISSPLAGTVLISPWASFSTNFDSATRNQYSDYVTGITARRWSSAFLGTSAGDSYSEPGHAPADWFSGLEKVVQDIFVWGGGGEVLIDSIDDIYTTLRNSHPRVEYVVQPNSSHEEFIIDKTLGYTHKADGTKAIEKWFLMRI
ncbi:alpha/beta-hydrolase [Polychaeton citri CBS 116435]|uniref:Alpha/beta-hydrolase n=1 Tax=Polychaeton citri CBS 116435 TaxID=1314669 RepID=A0A9P4PXW0_9PEZI|nr:alpha/beta-hydrolase [Polychaeton citri CBS 116435]